MSWSCLVVVRDAHGNVVGTLTKEDFSVFDNNKASAHNWLYIGKARSYQRLAKERHGKSGSSPASASTVPNRFVLFLFDDLHLSSEDLAHAQTASIKMLGESLAPSAMHGTFSISGKTNSGITKDRAKLTEAIMSIREQSLYRTVG